jgi:flagellar hook-length control protein FliK
MNVDGVNSAALLPSKTAIAGDAQALPEDGTIPEDFANALDGQKKLLREAKAQSEAPEQLQATDSPQVFNVPQKSTETQEELVALLEKYLPTPSPENMEGAPADIDAALSALTESLAASTPSLAPETPPVEMNGAMAMTGLAFVKPAPEEAKLNLPVEDMVSGDFMQNVTAFRQSAPKGQDFGLPRLENTESSAQTSTLEKQSFHSVLEKALPGVTPDMPPAPKPIDGRVDVTAIARPISHPNWGKDLGEQIMWMNNKDLSAAEIRLNPEHLGPISVRIDVNKDQQASIMFTAQHLEVKEAIEASIPKLREMLVSQQLNLVNVNISQHSSPDQGKPQPNPFRTMSENNDQGAEEVPGMESLGQTVVGKGLLSLYA